MHSFTLQIYIKNVTNEAEIFHSWKSEWSPGTRKSRDITNMAAPMKIKENVIEDKIMRKNYLKYRLTTEFTLGLQNIQITEENET